MSAEEFATKVETGDLSRDYGLDITVSDGGMVTSALNQRQYRAECNRLYQQFMLSMADYLFEEAQLKKRLQLLIKEKKQPRQGSAVHDDSERLSQADLDMMYAAGDEDAFTPAQMEEFRRLANSRTSNRPASRQAPAVATTEHPRPPTTMSIRAPSRAAMGGADTPHMFPGLRERPLTSTSKRQDSRAVSAASTRQGVIAGAALYGGRDIEYDGAMDPTADYSASRRLRMNPRTFSKLSACHSGRIKIRVMNKQGQFVMKPVSGRPGVVSVSTGQDKEEGETNPALDSKDKLAVVRSETSFNSPTLSSDLKINNLVAIQKSLKGHDAKRMTVNEVMAKSRDRRSRLFRVQAASGRLDDWDVPGENRRPPTRATSAGAGSLGRGPSRLDRGPSRLDKSPSRLESGPSRLDVTPGLEGPRPNLVNRSPSPSQSKSVIDVTIQRRDESPDVKRREKSKMFDRTKSAPAYRHKQAGKSSTPILIPAPGPSPIPTSQTAMEALAKKHASRSQTPKRPAPPTPQSKVAVIQLELEDQSPFKPPPSPIPSVTIAHPKSAVSSRRTPSSPTRAVFPVSAKSLADESSKHRQVSVRFGKAKKLSAAEQTAEKECSVHIRHIHTLRDSAAVVRRWKEFDQDREDKLNRWRMRMSFAATRRGNLGKVLSKV